MAMYGQYQRWKLLYINTTMSSSSSTFSSFGCLNGRRYLPCWRTSSSLSAVATMTTTAKAGSSNRRTRTLVHDGYSSGLVNYSKGWAWQHTLLNGRLNHQRKQQQQATSTTLNTNDENDIDVDRLLLLEHNHVYTLGRGASEEHLTFLNGEKEEMRWKLSRKARGKRSARLSVDRLQQQEDDKKNQSIQDEVNQLSNCSSPVYAPNGAPIYRIERGGEVVSVFSLQEQSCPT
mmetsp:Transcript_13970/g.20944  ORF Transcript_13970/g.20944 Transcript_13970/m.20944 type:complete len:232 (-) Transcript_13970:1074-1769(-)